MPTFLIERRFAEEIGEIDTGGLREINEAEGVRWLYSFLAKDRRKTYCLYEAESAEAIVAAARRAGLPADVVVEVTGTLAPDGSLSRF